MSLWKETHISYLYLPSLPTKFVTVSPFPGLQNSLIHYTSNQGIDFTAKKVCNAFMTGVPTGLIGVPTPEATGLT